MTRISIVGLGYVGLPLAVEFNKNGHSVVGYDIDHDKVESLKRDRDPAGQISNKCLEELEIEFTEDPSEISKSKFVVITVPTPLDDEKNPELKFLESAAMTVGRYVSAGSTVILESTVYPGATREVIVPALEETSNMVAGDDFSVGYSPERIVPGDTGPEFPEIVKIVGGLNEATTEKIAELYESIVDAGVHRVPSIEVAEAAKCLENTQRDVNIALINEFTMACDGLNVDSDEVLKAAATKWNFHEYSPGLVGGHCLPVDPYYLMYAYEQANQASKLIEEARRVNEMVPEYVERLVIDGLNQRTEASTKISSKGTIANGKGQVADKQGESILILGLTYKQNTSDTRTTAIRTIVENLRKSGREVVGYDPYVDNHDGERAFNIPMQETFDASGFEAVIVSVAHDEFLSFDLDAMSSAMGEEPVMVDVSGMFADHDPSERGFIYRDL